MEVCSLPSQQELHKKTMNSAMERLSSGLRINNAKDDAAGQGIATRLSAEINGS